jgi:1,4-alpha-glucan branching enzyme
MSTTRPLYVPPFDLQLFNEGKHWDIYRILGAHPYEEEGLAGYRFAVWAPNARSVHLTGDFNDWRHGEYPLYPVGLSGIWAGFLPGIPKGALYKYGVEQADGRIVYKSDPVAFHAEVRPGNASRTWDLDNHQWQDGEWMQRRKEQGLPLASPVSVYEIHAGSWRRKNNDADFLSYAELADQLIPYVKDLGFTHIQFMPLAEHPLDESWGYQVSHFYAPTSRFGRPEDFKAFVDRCHQAGIGVILDWVPGHFPKDDWCLGRFDGTALFEHSDPRQGEHPEWGTYIFNYGRHEVRGFLFANALYWLKEFHIDGLRIDAVASMLYLDYARKDGDWLPNVFGGKENLEAIDFLKELNKTVHGHYPGALMVAEESTDWPGVSRPLYAGGLGFTFKWNMGWMHDTLEFFAKDPLYRPHHHNNLTFSMLYAFTENFLLPLSHDEVAHGKGALASKMPGDQWQQQANLRLLLSYQWAHPGKKLLFMGGEFGQWSEWNSQTQLDWTLLDFPRHRGILNLVRELNRLQSQYPAMHRTDHDWNGFEWVDFSDYKASVVSFLRKTPGEKPLLWVFNFTPVPRYNYCLGCPDQGVWCEIFNSDSTTFGGSDIGNAGCATAQESHLGSWPRHLELSLPPLGALAFTPE